MAASVINCLRTGVVLAVVGLAVAVAAAQGVTGTKQGQGGSVVQGSAGTNGSKGDKGLEHCDKPMGAMAVVEPQDLVIASLRRYNLGSPTGLIRLMIQQSNCFIVVERGVGLQNAMQERALQQGGQLRTDSNVGGGQMVTADFILTPAVVFADNNAGGVGAAAAVGGLFGRTARRGRRRAQVQGSSDQHVRWRMPGAPCRWRRPRAARKRLTSASAACSQAEAAPGQRAATAARTKARSSPPR